MIAPVVAQTVCTLEQCNFCKGIDPDSWWWIFYGCWIIGSPAVAIGTFMAAYVGIQLWARRGH